MRRDHQVVEAQQRMIPRQRLRVGHVQTGTGDPDGDGLSTALESVRGYSPRLKDRLDDGGIASRRSAKLAFVGGTDTTYVIESTPPIS